jgi:hypothetical protein
MRNELVYHFTHPRHAVDMLAKTREIVPSLRNISSIPNVTYTLLNFNFNCIRILTFLAVYTLLQLLMFLLGIY